MVDPISAMTIRAILERFVAGDGSVMISSHVMVLVGQVRDHVGIMADGKVVADGPLDEVRSGVSPSSGSSISSELTMYSQCYSDQRPLGDSGVKVR